MKISYLGKQVYLCEVCGFGYVEEITANDCEDYCRANKHSSAQISKRATLVPQRIWIQSRGIISEGNICSIKMRSEVFEQQNATSTRFNFEIAAGWKLKLTYG